MEQNKNKDNFNCSNESLEAAKQRVYKRIEMTGSTEDEWPPSIAANFFEEGVKWVLEGQKDWENKFNKKFPNPIVEIVGGDQYSIFSEIKSFIRETTTITVSEQKRNELYEKIQDLFLSFMEKYGITFENIHISPADEQNLINYYKELNFIPENIVHLKDIAILGNIVSVVVERYADNTFTRYFSSNMQRDFSTVDWKSFDKTKPTKIGNWNGTVNEIQQRK